MELVLAEELGVSRTPVRNALARLADDGLLVYQPNRGFLVRRFEAKDVTDAFTLRATLEGLGCRLLAERGLEQDARARLAGLLEEQREVLYGREWSRERALLWQTLNVEFHFVLLELADNPWLTDAVKRTRQLPLIFDSRSRPHDHDALRLLFQRDHSKAALADHVGILSALTKRESTRAGSLMQEHIATNTDILTLALSGAPTADAPADGDAPAPK